MTLPSNFVYLNTIDDSILLDMKYFTDDNFLGRPVAGYHKVNCIITEPAALALSSVQKKLLSKNMSLKVFDCYRPQTAVNDFVAWSKDAHDQKMKNLHYPNINKADFFTLGYVSANSSHTRGSTADLTIVDLDNHQELDMGTCFDFMDELSHTLSSNISAQAMQNRLLLKNLMEQAGFVGFDKEWWHFTLKNEPYPDTYFDFLID